MTLDELDALHAAAKAAVLNYGTAWQAEAARELDISPALYLAWPGVSARLRAGVDILGNGALGDLKTATTCEPEALQRQAFKMFYHAQLAFYRRGARANGLDVSRGLFLLCVETKGPYEVVDLELSEGLIDLADRTVSLWLEKLRIYRDANQWPGYAQSPVVWDVPAWMRDDDEEGDS